MKAPNFWQSFLLKKTAYFLKAEIVYGAYEKNWLIAGNSSASFVELALVFILFVSLYIWQFSG